MREGYSWEGRVSGKGEISEESKDKGEVDNLISTYYLFSN